MNDEDLCPICGNHSLYAQCSCGEWVIGCEECEIETDICDSYEEADEQWNTMMKQRITFITKLD